MKKCSKCKREKDEKEFGIYYRNTDQLHSWCDTCKRQDAKNNNSRYTCGLTQKEFEFKLKLQNNRCAICQNHFDDDILPCIDHNHTTLTVRDLLCNKCNQAIGLLREDIKITEEAVKYLKKWEGKKPKLNHLFGV